MFYVGQYQINPAHVQLKKYYVVRFVICSSYLTREHHTISSFRSIWWSPYQLDGIYVYGMSNRYMNTPNIIGWLCVKQGHVLSYMVMFITLGTRWFLKKEKIVRKKHEKCWYHPSGVGTLWSGSKEIEKALQGALQI
jgi:hypothetical protein